MTSAIDQLEDRRRIAVFVDVQNIYYTVRDRYQQNFDYRKLWLELTEQGEIVHAFAYAVDRGDRKQQQFQQTLRNIGFEVKLKPYIQRQDGSSKGDWDVGITIDVLEYAAHVDLVVLATGDGDFVPLIERVKSRYGVMVQVVSVTSLTAKSLVDAADEHRPINGELLITR